MIQFEQVIKKISPYCFLHDFDVDAQLSRIQKEDTSILKNDVCLVLEIILRIKQTHKSFYIGTIIEQKTGYPIVEYSTQCFNIEDWKKELRKQFPEVQDSMLERILQGFIYYRYLR